MGNMGIGEPVDIPLKFMSIQPVPSTNLEVEVAAQPEEEEPPPEEAGVYETI